MARKTAFVSKVWSRASWN